MNKIWPNLAQAVSGVFDGSTILIGGFGDAGYPFELVEALAATDACQLTLVSNNAGHSSAAFLRLIAERRVSRIVCSYPVKDEPTLESALKARELELELVPQGTLAERIRAAAAGIPAFYSPTGVGTLLTAGRETRVLANRTYVLEEAIHADFALVKATIADAWGNLQYHAASQNFNPVMAMAGAVTIAQAARVVAHGEISPNGIHTPGIFVDRVVQTPTAHFPMTDEVVV